MPTVHESVTAFVTAVTAFNAQIDNAITGISGDIDNLNAQILALQNSPGTLSPEDQAALDAIQANGQAVATKLDALDALTPPLPPKV